MSPHKPPNPALEHKPETPDQIHNLKEFFLMNNWHHTHSTYHLLLCSMCRTSENLEACDPRTKDSKPNKQLTTPKEIISSQRTQAKTTKYKIWRSCGVWCAIWRLLRSATQQNKDDKI